MGVLEFVRDQILIEPDFGDEIDIGVRGALALGTSVEMIWTFDPGSGTVEIITPV